MNGDSRPSSPSRKKSNTIQSNKKVKNAQKTNGRNVVILGKHVEPKVADHIPLPQQQVAKKIHYPSTMRKIKMVAIDNEPIDNLRGRKSLMRRIGSGRRNSCRARLSSHESFTFDSLNGSGNSSDRSTTYELGSDEFDDGDVDITEVVTAKLQQVEQELEKVNLEEAKKVVIPIPEVTITTDFEKDLPITNFGAFDDNYGPIIHGGPSSSKIHYEPKQVHTYEDIDSIYRKYNDILLKKMDDLAVYPLPDEEEVIANEIRDLAEGDYVGEYVDEFGVIERAYMDEFEDLPVRSQHLTSRQSTAKRKESKGLVLKKRGSQAVPNRTSSIRGGTLSINNALSLMKIGDRKLAERKKSTDDTIESPNTGIESPRGGLRDIKSADSRNQRSGISSPRSGLRKKAGVTNHSFDLNCELEKLLDIESTEDLYESCELDSNSSSIFSGAISRDERVHSISSIERPHSVDSQSPLDVAADFPIADFKIAEPGLQMHLKIPLNPATPSFQVESITQSGSLYKDSTPPQNHSINPMKYQLSVVVESAKIQYASETNQNHETLTVTGPQKMEKQDEKKEKTEALKVTTQQVFPSSVPTEYDLIHPRVSIHIDDEEMEGALRAAKQFVNAQNHLQTLENAQNADASINLQINTISEEQEEDEICSLSSQRNSHAEIESFFENNFKKSMKKKLSEIETNSLTSTDDDDDKSYVSLDEADDPVNQVPPLTFSDMYRNTLPQAILPTYVRESNLPTNVQKLKEKISALRLISLPPQTQIPAMEAVALFDIINSEKFRQYYFTETELERYHLVTESKFINENVSSTFKISDNGEKNIAMPLFIKARVALRQRNYEVAINDLTAFLRFTPDPLVAYVALWERHQAHFLLGHIDLAIKDLEAITETNKIHVGAFITKARFYQEVGLNSLAIINYTQAISVKERHPDPYLQRGILAEQEGDTTMSAQDFIKVAKIDPRNTFCVYKAALHYFSEGMWKDSMKMLTQLLEADPLNGLYFAYRGRAYAHLGKWEKAYKNLSISIKLIPHDYKVFYYRGCFLSEVDFNQAVKDLSISILLEDGPENSASYYQRGLLYHKMGYYDCAIEDYISAIDYNSNLPLAYLNLGTIYMNYFQDYERALEYFDKTIVYDPGHVKAYLYRGDLYKMIEMEQKVKQDLASLDTAIKDYSKAIHLSPGNYQAYVHRGKLLLQRNKIREARNDLLVAYNLNNQFGSRFLQKASILAFEKRYDDIIFEFNKIKKLPTFRQDPLLFVEVGKACMNLARYDTAMYMFGRALSMMSKKKQTVLLQMGICHLKQDHFHKALQFFNQCVQIQHGYPEAHYYRGLCKLQLGNEKGIQDVLKALKYDPKYFNAHMLLAVYYYEQKMYPKCVEACRNALDVEPFSVQVALLEGCAQLNQHKYMYAIDIFTQVIVDNPKCHDAFYNRAIAHQYVKDVEQAIKDYSVTLLITEDSNAYRNRGLLYWQNQDTDNALSDLHAAKDYFPEDAYLHALLAMCLQKIRNYDESIHEFNVAVKIDPFMRGAYLGRGNVYVSKGDLQSARRDYARVIRLYPKSQEAYVNIAFTYQMEGKSKRAWEVLNQILAIDPNLAMPYEARAMVNYYMKNYFNALTDISKALELDPNNAEYLCNKGLIYQAMGDHSEAFRHYQLAIKHDVHYQLAYFNKANMYFANARWEDALKTYSQAILLEKKNIHSLLNRGITKIMLKDYEGAFADFQSCINIDPHFPQVYANRGHLYKLLDQPEKAEQDLTRALEINPTDTYVLYERAKSRGAQRNMPDALKDLSEFLKYENQSN